MLLDKLIWTSTNVLTVLHQLFQPFLWIFYFQNGLKINIYIPPLTLPILLILLTKRWKKEKRSFSLQFPSSRAWSTYSKHNSEHSLSSQEIQYDRQVLQVLCGRNALGSLVLMNHMFGIYQIHDSYPSSNRQDLYKDFHLFQSRNLLLGNLSWFNWLYIGIWLTLQTE